MDGICKYRLICYKKLCTERWHSLQRNVLSVRDTVRLMSLVIFVNYLCKVTNWFRTR